MKHNCHSTQWDPIGFYIIQYDESKIVQHNETKIIKNVNYVKRWYNHVYNVVGNRS